jgi:hypothetical protein
VERFVVFTTESIMVWIVEWHQPGQNEVNVTCWASEADALRIACHEMLESLPDNWDLDDSEGKANARTVNDLVANGDYRAALNEYSDFESESNNYEYSQYWNVYERQEGTHAKMPTLLLLDNPDPNEDEDDDDDEDEDEENYQASCPGATCRGPNCGYVSPDAYADKRDGTFVCYQCRMMSQVFGSTIK